MNFAAAMIVPGNATHGNHRVERSASRRRSVAERIENDLSR